MQLVKEAITEMALFWAIIISKNIITIYLSKKQALDSGPKAIQQINFTGDLAQAGNADTTMLFIIEEAKETR